MPVHALTVVAFIGAITALLGALIAVAQNDIKRVLAFSTVSQLGYMMLALGVGSWVAAIFHLLTHAFFKALLFLGAGSVIHAAHHEQDIRRLGGLRPRMKVTFATFAIGMMALAGVPFLFSGFWSKEAILHAAHEWDVSHLPLYAGLAAVVLTAFYMTRLVAETFFGQPRSANAEHAHESPAVMTVPLVLLAVCAIALGFLGTPAWPWLQARLSGQTEVHGHPIFEGAGLMMLSIVLVALGLGAGWALHPTATADRGAPFWGCPRLDELYGPAGYGHDGWAITAGKRGLTRPHRINRKPLAPGLAAAREMARTSGDGRAPEQRHRRPRPQDRYDVGWRDSLPRDNRWFAGMGESRNRRGGAEWRIRRHQRTYPRHRQGLLEAQSGRRMVISASSRSVCSARARRNVGVADDVAAPRPGKYDERQEGSDVIGHLPTYDEHGQEQRPRRDDAGVLMRLARLGSAASSSEYAGV